jgi:hypothetical protein
MTEASSTREAMRNLGSSEPDDAARAADALYRSGAAAEILAEADAGAALRASVERGNRTASAVLLLGYVPDARDLLHKLVREHGDAPVKLHPWSDIVPLRLAALAALSRLGDRDARLRLLESSAELDTAGRLFLLDILPFLDAPEVWHALSDYMADPQEIRADVPSGAPRRRLCDHAVDAFLDRFAFDVSFARKVGGRYAPGEIEETQRALRSSVPQ